MSKKKTRQKRGTGGLRCKGGKIEGTFTVYRQNGTSIKKSFMRDTEREINDIKAKLRLLGLVDNDVKGIEIDKKTNEIRLIKNENKSSKIKVYSDMLVRDYINYYLFGHRKKGERGKIIEETTFLSYCDKAKYIEEYLGNKKMTELTVDDLQEFIDKLQQRGLSYSNVKQVRNVLTTMIRYAKKDGVITENILADEKLALKQSNRTKEKYIIKKEDRKTFIDYCIKNKYYDLIFLMTTGLRAGELAGLCWKDIDFNNATAKIYRQYKRVTHIKNENNERIRKSVKEFKDLKTKASYRTVWLTDIIDLLKVHKEEQKELALKNNKAFTEEDFVFTTSKYTAMLNDYLWARVKKVMNSIKIENYDKISTHNLRHTYISMCAEKGVSIKEAQMLAGHSDIGITLVYTHLQEQQLEEASNKATNDIAKYIKLDKQVVYNNENIV